MILHLNSQLNSNGIVPHVHQTSKNKYPKNSKIDIPRVKM